MEGKVKEKEGRQDQHQPLTWRLQYGTADH